MAKEEQNIYLRRAIEREELETPIYTNSLVGADEVYLKCKLFPEEYQQLFSSQESFVRKVLNSWKKSFHRMVIQSMHLWDSHSDDFLIITIINDTPFDKIDAQRIVKWGEALSQILVEYRMLALENVQLLQEEQRMMAAETAYQEQMGEQQFADEEIIVVPEEMTESEVVAEKKVIIQEKEVFHPSREPEPVVADIIAEPVEEFEIPATKIEAVEEVVAEVAPTAEVEVATAPEEGASQTLLTTSSLIPKIQDELTQMLNELGSLKSSIGDFRLQTEGLPQLPQPEPEPIVEKTVEPIVEQLEEFADEEIAEDEFIETEFEAFQPVSEPEETYTESEPVEELADLVEETKLQKVEPQKPAIQKERIVFDRQIFDFDEEEEQPELEEEVVEAPKKVVATMMPTRRAFREALENGDPDSLFVETVVESEPIYQSEEEYDYYQEPAFNVAEPVMYEDPEPEFVAEHENLAEVIPMNQFQGKVTLKLNRVLEEINNMERQNDMLKSYQYKNKREISKIGAKILTAHLQNGSTRVNYQEFQETMKQVAFITEAWRQVKLIQRDRNPIYFNDCDIETLVEDAIDFYETEAKNYLEIRRPKFTKKIQISNKFYLLIDAYCELERYLESLLVENLSKPILFYQGFNN
ncbi:hypothetical protein M2139_002103 [Enterococcus sp. PF1-24]|uniref:hypothetical protein n=1 Tax=unclassified Enterococcus TaxID=2608891 RepID=UPI0024741770|nr:MULTISPECIES: hypothetical protein [unclassified Enterococcus]MDH6365102.1 hypothetical protein [Enterococcus sp. PFB1-1]MDH6402203.1 hypothetical protein [Enterococcus sp. PF1-24]